MKNQIRKGDRVRVLRGDAGNKGKVGEVIRVLPKENRVVVQGVNIVKKHQKQTQSGGKTLPAGILEFEAPIDLSNVALFTETDEKETRTARTAARATERTPAQKKAAEKKPVEKKPAEKKPAEKKPAEKKPAEKKAAEKPAARPARRTTATQPAAKKSSNGGK